jgi:hypothetical protein
MEIENILKDEKNVVLDTSIFIAYLVGENSSIISLLDHYIFNIKSDIELYGNVLLKSEIYYIICRMKGIDKADMILKKVDELIYTVEGSNLVHIAGKIKCKYPITLSDCYSIATSIVRNCPAFFLKEKELSDEIIKNINSEFNSKIYIVE